VRRRRGVDQGGDSASSAPQRVDLAVFSGSSLIAPIQPPKPQQGYHHQSRKDYKTASHVEHGMPSMAGSSKALCPDRLMKVLLAFRISKERRTATTSPSSSLCAVGRNFRVTARRAVFAFDVLSSDRLRGWSGSYLHPVQAFDDGAKLLESTWAGGHRFESARRLLVGVVRTQGGHCVDGDS